MADEVRKEGASEASARHLDLDDYASIGGIAHALSRHADEILADLPGLELAVEQVFRALSEVDKDGRATRRALPFSQLLAETGLLELDLRKVLDRFRADDCSFLVPALSIVPKLMADTRIDVGHEALLRRWERISPDPAAALDDATEASRMGWLRVEQEDGRRYRRLLAFAEFGRITLPIDQIERSWEWWTARPRTKAWTERYGGGFALVEHLFEESRAALAAEREREEMMRLARRRRRMLSIAGLAVAIITVVSFALYTAKQQTELETMRADNLKRQLEAERGKDVTQGGPPLQTPQPPQAPAPPQPAPEPQRVPQPEPAPQAPPPARSPTALTTGTCKSDTTPAFMDDFKTQDPAWNLTDKNETYYADGQLAIKAEANTTWAVVYRPLLYTNATACLDLKTPTSVKDMERPSGGLIFWAVDYRNYYVALIYPDGGYLITRKVAGNWATISSRKKNDAVKAGLGVTNQVKVTTTGNIATLFINGHKIQNLRGQPPKTGGAVGVFGESEKSQQNEWRYLDIVVTELPRDAPTPPMGPAEPVVKAMLAACKSGPTAAFADDFKVVDTGWIGVPSENANLVDGQLRIKAAVNSSWRTAYWSLIFENITVCADVKSPTGIKALDDTSGGLIFWGTDFDNYYSVSIFPDGSYGIDRRVQGSIIKVVPKAAHTSVNKGPAAENRVKVVINGSTGTLYINNVEVQDFRGQPPAGGSAIGLFGESETNQRDEWAFSGFVVSESLPGSLAR